MVCTAQAGEQRYEPLAASVQAAMHGSVADRASSRLVFMTAQQGRAWLSAMSQRLAQHISDEKTRLDFLITVQYEARRAGLDPQMVLGLIEVESRFRKYAVSRAGARGYMQVMPFWIDLIGRPGDNLFSLRNNLRYGCVILKYYLDAEKGDLARALGRYNGSLGKSSDYPNMVIGAWRSMWSYQGRLTHTPIQAGNTLAMVDCIACAAARGSAAWRIGRPTTM